MNALTDKMDLRGVSSLTDGELLALLLGDEAMAATLLDSYDGSLARIAGEERTRLRMVGGMGLHRARLVHVAAELGRRIACANNEQAEVITSSEDVVRIMQPQLETLAYEECWVLYLTASNRLIERQRVSQGGISGTVVDHRLIVKRALELLATRLILVHNHPSGAAEASGQDRQLTRKISEAAALFDIKLLDHLILAKEGHFSFRQAGLL